MMRPTLVYLASPYSHPVRAVRNDRFRLVVKASAALRRQYGHRYVFFSPIAHSHPISEYYGNPNDSAFWVAEDLAILRRFDELWVLMLDGWLASNGIRDERMTASEIAMPVRFVEYDPDADRVQVYIDLGTLAVCGQDYEQWPTEN